MNKVRIFSALCIISLICLVGIGLAQPLDFANLVENVEHRLNDVSDIQAIATISQMEGDRANLTVFSIAASKDLQVTRIEILEPDLLAGQIIVVDQAQNLVKMYMPILGQTLVQDLSGALNMGMNLDFTDLNLIFDLRGIDGEIIDVIQTDQGYRYLVQVSELDSQLDLVPGLGTADSHQLVWIGEDFTPYQVEFFAGGHSQGTFYLQQIITNSGLTLDEVADLPQVPEIRI